MEMNNSQFLYPSTSYEAPYISTYLSFAHSVFGPYVPLDWSAPAQFPFQIWSDKYFKERGQSPNKWAQESETIA